jgi:hypothetical protein
MEPTTNTIIEDSTQVNVLSEVLNTANETLNSILNTLVNENIDVTKNVDETKKVDDAKNATTNEKTNSPKNTSEILSETVGLTMISLDENNVIPISDVELILSIIRSSAKIDSLLDKLNCTLDNNTRQKINNILDFLSQNNVKLDNEPPVKNIISGIKDVFNDGKLDLSDIPTLITLVTNMLNTRLSCLKIKIDTNIITIIIKLLIHTLITEKVIKISETEEKSIDKLIDSSIVLLNTTIAISNVRCSCLPCFGNKK